jgi:hypothetical protein
LPVIELQGIEATHFHPQNQRRVLIYTRDNSQGALAPQWWFGGSMPAHNETRPRKGDVFLLLCQELTAQDIHEDG